MRSDRRRTGDTLFPRFHLTAEDNSAKGTQLWCNQENFFQEDAVSHLVAHNKLLTASVTMSTGWFVCFQWTLKQAQDFKVEQIRTLSSCFDVRFFFCARREIE